MKSAHLKSQRAYQKRDELLARAVERREKAFKAWRNAPKGERDRRFAELKAATAAELRASW